MIRAHSSYLNSRFFLLLGKGFLPFSPIYLIQGRLLLVLYKMVKFVPPPSFFCLSVSLSVILFVNLLSASLSTWPGHFYFADFMVWTRSLSLVCSHIQEARFLSLSLYLSIILSCARWIDLFFFNFWVRFQVSEQ